MTDKFKRTGSNQNIDPKYVKIVAGINEDLLGAYDENVFVIHPPEGTEFKECPLCKNPFVYNGMLSNCLWCEINKDD